MDHTDTISSVLKSKGREVYTTRPSTSVYDALANMADHHIGALLVVEDERLLGVVSERDYARKVILQGRSSKDTLVSEIMTPDLFTVTPRETVDHCMKLMTEHRIRHLPVLENGQIAGVVSLGDLVKWIITTQEAEIQHLQAYIAGSYTTT
jgi:CBS domain-containing protein